MSKLLPFALAGIGATATSVGGVYLIRGTTASAQKSSEGKSTEPDPFDTLSSFRDSKDQCVKDLFGEDLETKTLTGVQDMAGSVPSGDQYFGAVPTDTGAETKGCLIIKWKKTKYTEGDHKDKWRGIFNWSWSFKNKDRGFIIFNVAKTKEANKLDVFGGTYLLEKEATGGKWKIKYKKEVESGKEITESNFETNFPKVKANSGISLETGDHWGFADKGELSKICQESSCSTGGSDSAQSQRWSWRWQSSGDNRRKISEWTNDLVWWNHIYGLTGFNLDTKLGGFSGIWTEAK